jgi:hypothetical protein
MLPATFLVIQSELTHPAFRLELGKAYALALALTILAVKVILQRHTQAAKAILNRILGHIQRPGELFALDGVELRFERCWSTLSDAVCLLFFPARQPQLNTNRDVPHAFLK